MQRILLCPLSIAALAVLLSAPAQAVDCDTSMSSYTTQINCNNGWFSGSAQHTCSDRQISVPSAGCCKIRAKCERWSGDSDGNWSDITVNWPKAQNVVNCQGILEIYPCSTPTSAQDAVDTD